MQIPIESYLVDFLFQWEMYTKPLHSLAKNKMCEKFYFIDLYLLSCAYSVALNI